MKELLRVPHNQSLWNYIRGYRICIWRETCSFIREYKEECILQFEDYLLEFSVWRIWWFWMCVENLGDQYRSFHNMRRNLSKTKGVWELCKGMERQESWGGNRCTIRSSISVLTVSIYGTISSLHFLRIRCYDSHFYSCCFVWKAQSSRCSSWQSFSSQLAHLRRFASL